MLLMAFPRAACPDFIDDRPNRGGCETRAQRDEDALMGPMLIGYVASARSVDEWTATMRGCSRSSKVASRELIVQGMLTDARRLKCCEASA